MKYKLIAIEGTDCSGKNTQTKKLLNSLNEMGISTKMMSFPNYESATGKIIGGPLLGKTDILATGSYFGENQSDISPLLFGSYFAIDRFYNKPFILNNLRNSCVILDRYIDSNLAYQAGKEMDKNKRYKLYKWFEKLEYGLYKMPKPDIKILLYVPFEQAQILKAKRQQKTTDIIEKDEQQLKNAELAYLEIAKRNHYKIINCTNPNGQGLLSIDEIAQKVLDYVTSKLK